VSKLKKQPKVQPFQDNHNNMVNNLEKEKTAPKIVSQPPKKQAQKEGDEKVKYARSVFFNARRSHIKSVIGYKNSGKHNSRVNTKDQEFIKFTKSNVPQEKKQNTKITDNVSHSYANASNILHMSYYDFDTSYVLMRNKIGKIVALHVGPHHKRSKTCVWVSKCLVTNLR
jgi:hypothetical protein